MKYVTCFLGSKVFDPRDQTPDQWAARVDPVMDVLLAAKVADEFVPAWEMDAFNVPGPPTIAYCNGGVAATVVLFHLARLGFPELSNYDGSWNEWGERPDLPAESPGPK